jgi:hypothetical protein
MKSLSSAQAAQPPQPPRKRRRWLRIFVVGIAAVMLMCGGLVFIPVVSPSAGAAMADWLRSIIGPEAVAEIESVSFKLQDTFNQTRYQVSGGQAQVSWADPADTNASTSTKANAPKTANVPTKAQPSDKITTVTANPINPAVPNVITAPSDVGDWQAFGPTINGDPFMARTIVKPDPARAYAQAMLVRIDLSQIQLHLMPGTVEPVAVKGVPPFPRPGFIPSADQANLLAAFNGGFKSIHGDYGVMLNGVTIRPPIDGLATIGLYHNGQIRIGAWGSDITATPDLITYRQNCPLLVDQGAINPHVNDENRKEWGYTVKNLDTTWRSGIGLSQDGRFLIYAAGNSLTVESLAEALRQAGSYYAMQLDINGFYTRFVTYTSATNPKTGGYSLVANKLLNEMSGDPALYLHPYDRDFFYITVRTKS